MQIPILIEVLSFTDWDLPQGELESWLSVASFLSGGLIPIVNILVALKVTLGS